MWKAISLVALLLIFSVFLGWVIEQDPGYILISYQNWSIETSLWFGLAVLIIVIFLSYLSYKLLKHSVVLPSRLAKWTFARKQKLAAMESHYGIAELLEANWNKAERRLLKSAKYMPTPFTNYVAAAYAAQKQNAYTQRDEYLQKAASSLRGSEMAIDLLKAEFQIQSEQAIQALHGLQKLQIQNPKHPQVLKLLQTVYAQLNEWPALLHLLPALVKYSAMRDEELKPLTLKVYSELLKEASAKKDRALFEQAWLAVPNAWKMHTDLLVIFSDFYLKENADEQVIKLLEEVLKKNWDERLVNYYGLARGKSSARQLRQAETWLKQHSHDANLLLCLGRLSAQDQLWGKAQDYLTASINLQAQAITYWELAKIQEKLKLVDAAALSYQKGLQLAIGR